jgi:hypothetical protein
MLMGTEVLEIEDQSADCGLRFGVPYFAFSGEILVRLGRQVTVANVGIAPLELLSSTVWHVAV